MDIGSALKYIFRYDVVTEDTRFIMNLAAPVNSVKWPGHKFNKGSEEFQALLGTPHGKGIVYMIATHCIDHDVRDTGFFWEPDIQYPLYSYGLVDTSS